MCLTICVLQYVSCNVPDRALLPFISYGHAYVVHRDRAGFPIVVMVGGQQLVGYTHIERLPAVLGVDRDAHTYGRFQIELSLVGQISILHTQIA